MLIVSSTVGSSTSTGWKRRSKAASFSMCSRYSSRVVAPTQCSSPRASIGLSMLLASMAPWAAPAPTTVCSSSIKTTIWPCSVGDFFEGCLEALLKLSAELGSGDHGSQVELYQLFVLQALRYIAAHDTLGQSLGDGGLAGARLADEDRVVFGPAAENLDHAANLFVPTDDWIELALAGQVGQVPAVPIQGLVGALRCLRSDPLAAADGGQRPQDGVLGETRALQEPS